MTETEVQEIIKDIPVGSKLEIIKKDGTILDVVLSSHDTNAVEEKNYDSLTVPHLPPALIVQGRRWGVYRMEIDEISNIAVLETKKS
ncbi:hypothetical protein [Fulvivirga lutea]|uniref:Uncharacterized protein n=1 Tax=Fulvivirga lutea TaxID=2810512 RepID=A0A974WEP1_9BACT|nr:hypothetical protein [Fulvivirga lutea]QSE96480.1 hypothetical protein JR347_12825 [Fulvivirga lutea]